MGIFHIQALKVKVVCVFVISFSVVLGQDSTFVQRERKHMRAKYGQAVFDCCFQVKAWKINNIY